MILSFCLSSLIFIECSLHRSETCYVHITNSAYMPKNVPYKVSTYAFSATFHTLTERSWEALYNWCVPLRKERPWKGKSTKKGRHGMRWAQRQAESILDFSTSSNLIVPKGNVDFSIREWTTHTKYRWNNLFIETRKEIFLLPYSLYFKQRFSCLYEGEGEEERDANFCIDSPYFKKIFLFCFSMIQKNILVKKSMQQNNSNYFGWWKIEDWGVQVVSTTSSGCGLLPIRYHDGLWTYRGVCRLQLPRSWWVCSCHLWPRNNTKRPCLILSSSITLHTHSV